MNRRALLIERWNPSLINKRGDAFWINNKEEWHRDGDQPAVAYASGEIWWCKNGEPCRGGDNPSVIDFDGSMYWYKDWKYHRDGDKPAVVYSDGSFGWYINGNGYSPPIEAVYYWSEYYWEYFEDLKNRLKDA